MFFSFHSLFIAVALTLTFSTFTLLTGFNSAAASREGSSSNSSSVGGRGGAAAALAGEVAKNSGPRSAADVVNFANEMEIREIVWRYGDEKRVSSFFVLV